MEARFCLGGLSDPFLMQDLNTEGEFAPTYVGGGGGIVDNYIALIVSVFSVVSLLSGCVILFNELKLLKLKQGSVPHGKPDHLSCCLCSEVNLRC